MKAFSCPGSWGEQSLSWSSGLGSQIQIWVPHWPQKMSGLPCLNAMGSSNTGTGMYLHIHDTAKLVNPQEMTSETSWKEQTKDHMQQSWSEEDPDIRLTLGHLLPVFHWFEVDGGHRADHLHGFCFHQTGVLLVPTSPFQEQTSDIHTILTAGIKKMETRWE